MPDSLSCGTIATARLPAQVARPAAADNNTRRRVVVELTRSSSQFSDNLASLPADAAVAAAPEALFPPRRKMPDIRD
jgi:hypothetical protein